MRSIQCYICFLIGGLLTFASSGLSAEGLTNGDFSRPLKSNGMPPGWIFYSWPSGGRPDGISLIEEGGEASVQIEAVSKDPIGIVSTPFDITPYRNGMRVEFEVRRSADFQGSRAWTFATWNNGEKWIGRYDFPVPTLTMLSTQWKAFRVDISSDNIPEETVKLSLNFAVNEYHSQDGVRGWIAFRKIKITPLDRNEVGPPTVPVKLSAARTGAWWTLGEPVRYTVEKGKFPAKMTELEGRITNVRGEAVTTVSVPKAIVEKEGWSWNAPEPGFYTVRFFAKMSEGEPLALRPERLTLRAPNGEVSDLPHDHFQFVVMAPRLPEVGHGGQLGFTYTFNLDAIPLAKDLGFDLALLHSVGWGAQFTKLDKALEPEKGVYKWDILDPHVDALAQAGIEMIANICYTPVWASPHPEQVNTIDVCVRKATAYAPKDMNDFRTFMEKLVTRYKDRIHIWEIWNEPNMPGTSCFWSDTPANYVKLLQAGYETIKKVQPDSDVWLGGLGARANYHAFYWNVLRGGAGPYYDTLSVHGSWNNPTPYRRIEESVGAKARPVVNSEWHAILCGNFQKGPFPSESALTDRMLKDYLQQLRGGVQRSVLFEMLNLVEVEELDFAVEQRWFLNSSGLFRKRPRIEPRLSALAIATFLNLTGKKATYVNEYPLPSGGAAVELKTARGKLLVLWVAAAAKPADVLGKLAASDSALCDWESKPLTATSAQPLLQPGLIYFLTNPTTTALAALKPGRVLINPREQQQQAFVGSEATLLSGELLKSSDGATINHPWPIASNWNWIVTLNTNAAPMPLTARAAVSAHAAGLDIVVEVTDATHVQNEKSDRLWYGDSLQLAIDCEGNGLIGGQSEFAAALTAQGPVIMKTAAAELRGDLPTNWSPAGQPARFAQCAIQRDGNKTIYHLRLPWSELYPLAYTPTKPIRLSLLLNQNDGAGRVGYLEWGSGIGGDKNPAQYGTLQPPASK